MNRLTDTKGKLSSDCIIKYLNCSLYLHFCAASKSYQLLKMLPNMPVLYFRSFQVTDCVSSSRLSLCRVRPSVPAASSGSGSCLAGHEGTQRIVVSRRDKTPFYQEVTDRLNAHTPRAYWVSWLTTFLSSIKNVPKTQKPWRRDRSVVNTFCLNSDVVLH